VRRVARQIEVRGQPEQGRHGDEGCRVLFGIVDDVDDNAIRFTRRLATAPTYGLREQKRRLRRPRHNDRSDLRDVDPFQEQFTVYKDIELAEPECFDDCGALAHRKLAVHARGIDAGRSETCGHRIAVHHVRSEHEGRPALGKRDVSGRVHDDAVAFRRVDRQGERALVVVPFSVGGDGWDPIQIGIAVPEKPPKRDEPVGLDHVPERPVEDDFVEHVAQADLIGPAAGGGGPEQQAVLARRLPVLRKKPEVAEHGEVRLCHGPVRLVHGHEGPLLRPVADEAIRPPERLNRRDGGQIA
jgi:hypothetical protein